MSRIVVMNSAMMPNDGTYVCKYVDSETFKKHFIKHMKNQNHSKVLLDIKKQPIY